MKTAAKKVILKNKAKTLLAGKYYVIIMALLFFSMITLVLNRFTIILNRAVCLNVVSLFHVKESSLPVLIVSYVVPFFASIFLGIMQIGITLFFLNVTVGNPYFVSDLLYGYTHDFKKSFCLSTVTNLLSFVCTIPTNVLLDVRDGSISMGNEGILFMIALQVVLFCIYIPITLALSQIYFLNLDYPDLTAGEIIKRSIKIMKGKKLQLFSIQLSFVPLFLLGIFSFGLGLFWVIPYLKTTCTLYYLDIMRPEDPTYQAN